MKNLDLKKAIMRIAISKDKKSFSVVFDYFAPRLMGYLISSGSQKELAEEITQEVLSTVWQKAYQFDYDKGNVSTWIFTIARNKRVDRFRRNENPFYNKGELIEALYQEESKENLDLEEKTQELLSNLSKNERKLLKMNFFEGKTHNIISKHLEIPLGTVKSKIRNILKKMRNL
jgi:RNA polymerase sigma factor (sigma-70 family)